MTDKEFRKLSRGELVDIIFELQKEQEALKRENEALRARLEDRSICLSESGSIAEAALRLNGVFDAAQKAADQYLAQIQADNAELEQKCTAALAQAQKQADAMLSQARREAEACRAEAERDAAACREQAQKETAALREQTDREIAEKWDAIRKKTDSLLRSHEELKALLGG